MSYIDIDTIIDECATDIASKDDVAQYMGAVDRAIEIECALNSVRIDEIPVDQNGFTTSRILIEFGILHFKKLLFQGYAGSASGDSDDVYVMKLDLIDKDYRDIKTKLTRQSILGVFTEDGTPKGRLSTFRAIPMVSGATGTSGVIKL